MCLIHGFFHIREVKAFAFAEAKWLASLAFAIVHIGLTPAFIDFGEGKRNLPYAPNFLWAVTWSMDLLGSIWIGLIVSTLIGLAVFKLIGMNTISESSVPSSQEASASKETNTKME